MIMKKDSRRAKLVIFRGDELRASTLLGIRRGVHKHQRADSRPESRQSCPVSNLQVSQKREFECS